MEDWQKILKPRKEANHWQGMPEFVQDNKKYYAEIKVYINSEENLKKFSRLVGQNITEKTKFIFFPKLGESIRRYAKYVDRGTEGNAGDAREADKAL